MAQADRAPYILLDNDIGFNDNLGLDFLIATRAVVDLKHLELRFGRATKEI